MAENVEAEVWRTRSTSDHTKTDATGLNTRSLAICAVMEIHVHKEDWQSQAAPITRMGQGQCLG